MRLSDQKLAGGLSSVIPHLARFFPQFISFGGGTEVTGYDLGTIAAVLGTIAAVLIAKVASFQCGACPCFEGMECRICDVGNTTGFTNDVIDLIWSRRQGTIRARLTYLLQRMFYNASLLTSTELNRPCLYRRI